MRTADFPHFSENGAEDGLSSEARNHDLSVHNLHRSLDQDASRNAVKAVAYLTSFLGQIAFRCENDALPIV